MDTRLGKLNLNLPQVRGDVQLYPSCLEKGLRSERALKLAMAEMYVNGVSTRKVTEVLEALCGLEATSTQVSRATRLLDDELEKWLYRIHACPINGSDDDRPICWNGSTVKSKEGHALQHFFPMSHPCFAW